MYQWNNTDESWKLQCLNSTKWVKWWANGWCTGSGKAPCSKGRHSTQGKCPPCGSGGLQFFQCTHVWWVHVTEAQSFQGTALELFQQNRSHPQVESCPPFPHAWGSGKPGFCNINKWYTKLKQKVVSILVLFFRTIHPSLFHLPTRFMKVWCVSVTVQSTLCVCSVSSWLIWSKRPHSSICRLPCGNTSERKRRFIRTKWTRP